LKSRLLACLVALATSGSQGMLASAGEGEGLPRADQAVSLLLRIPSGHALVLKAQRFWNEDQIGGVLKHLAYGPVSRTDAVLTRHFNPSTGEEVRERAVTVILKREQPLEEMALDLAHELTHAIVTPTWDPYDPKLTPGRYVWAALEAEGGEVHAVTNECQAALELATIAKVSTARCGRYVDRAEDAPPQVNREKVRKDFYRIGRWNRAVRKRLGAEVITFPMLSGEAPELYSATGGAPYPVALIREYDELNRVACENVRRRMKSQVSRSPASLLSLPSHTKAFQGQELLLTRCRSPKSRTTTTQSSSSDGPADAKPVPL